MAIADCALPPAQLQEQTDRYRRLAASAIAVEQHDLRLEITFSPALDEDLLHKTLQVERECCSFFTLDYDAPARRLCVGVSDAGRSGALDAVRAALSGGLAPADEA